MPPSLPIRTTERHGRKRYELDLREIKAGRKFYPTETAAKYARQEKLKEFESHGSAFVSISNEERHEIAALRLKLKEAGATLGEAVRFFFTHNKGSVPVKLADAVQECLDAKARSGKRKRSIAALGYVLRAFVAGREGKLCSEITRDEIEEWVHNPAWALRTRKGKLIDIGTFFRWATAKGYCRQCPTDKIEPILIEHKPPAILTPEQAKALLNTTRELYPQFIPYVALCLFAGIRPAEVFRLTWANIDMEKGFVRIEAQKSKTRSRRIVRLEPNAIAWLKLGGTLPPVNWQRNFDRVRDVAGIRVWGQDCMRHSYCSYSLPIHGAMRTAENAGHSEQMLFKHYRELVTEDDAKKFWAIVP